MPPPPPLRLHAVVQPDERPIIRQVAAMLSRSLSRAAAAPWPVEFAFPAALPAPGAETPTLIVVSLLHEATKFADPWAAAETRLRETCRDQYGHPTRIVYLCTLFRHVDPHLADHRAILARIRRLNLLALNLSREFGLLIADIDRDLADIGAARLQTDYRLRGETASFTAAKSLALTMLHAGLDHAVPPETQDTARRRLKSATHAQLQPARHTPSAIGEFGYRLQSGRLRQIAMQPAPGDA